MRSDLVFKSRQARGYCGQSKLDYILGHEGDLQRGTTHTLLLILCEDFLTLQ